MIPSSISMLKSLEDLNLSGCSKGPVSMFWKSLTKPQESVLISAASTQGLSCLLDLDLSDCNMSYVPSEIGSLMSLRMLTLDQNKIRSLPSSLSNLCHLEGLSLKSCDKLRLLSDLPRSLMSLWAEHCNSLEPESVGALLGKVKYISFASCRQLDDNNFWRSIMQSYRGDYASLVFPSFELPDVFYFQGVGSRLSFVVPPHFHQKIKGWIVCALIDNNSGFLDNCNYFRYEVINKSKGTIARYPRPDPDFAYIDVRNDVVLAWEFIMGSGCVMWVNYVPLFEDEFNNIEELDEMELVYISDYYEEYISDYYEEYISDYYVKKCGIKLIYEDDDKGMELNKQLTCIL